MRSISPAVVISNSVSTRIHGSEDADIEVPPGRRGRVLVIRQDGRPPG
jgi:hypothetical protein